MTRIAANQKVHWTRKIAPNKAVPKFSLGFSDEFRSIRRKMSIRHGEIGIPSGKDWLAREIYQFSADLLDVLFSRGRLRSFSYWQEPLLLGLKEAINNSVAHAVWEGGTIFIRWRLSNKSFEVEVADTGTRPFDFSTKTTGKSVTDAFGGHLAGRGIGLGYIEGAADKVTIEPVISNENDAIIGHKVVFTGYFVAV